MHCCTSRLCIYPVRNITVYISHNALQPQVNGWHVGMMCSSVCLSVHCIVSDLPRRGGALCSVASLKASLPCRSWRTRRSTLIIMCVPDPRCVAVPSGHLQVMVGGSVDLDHGLWRPTTAILFVTSGWQTKVQRLYSHWIILPIIFSM